MNGEWKYHAGWFLLVFIAAMVGFAATFLPKLFHLFGR
jgi:hypothetical protein